jgi:antitoxin HicB
MKFRIIYEQDEDGIFVAECINLPGCISQGKTLQEAKENIKESIEGYIESLNKHNEPIPPSIYEDVIEVAA